jgi:hypothetical protein
MSRPKLMHGARVLCYINGKLFGVVTSFSWSSSTPRRKIHTIDIPHPVELATTTVDVTWNMGMLRILGDGGAQGAEIVAQQSDISREKYFSILLLERQTDLPLFKADLCVTESEQWSANAKGIVQGQISGSGILWSNETNQR